jgi:hypothetical protein
MINERIIARPELDPGGAASSRRIPPIGSPSQCE